MKTRRSLILGGVVIVLAIGVNACDLPDTSDLPVCSPDELQAPTSLSPRGEHPLVDPAPNLYLDWEYPPTSCRPDFFELYLWTGLEPEVPGVKVRIPYSQAYSPGRWRAPWGVSLLPGKTYQWRVYAGLETGPGPDVSGPDTLAYFLTGPECPDILSGNADYQPVLLLNPADEAVITSPTDPILFVWDDPTGCLVDYFYQQQIWNGDGPPDPDSLWEWRYGCWEVRSFCSLTPAQLRLEDCRRYYWRIKTDPAGPQEDPFSEIHSFVTNFHAGLCPITTDMDRLEWNLTVPQDLLCRLGPGLEYGIHRPLREGEQATVEGRNPERTWWHLLTESQDRCWVPDGLVDLIVGWELIPVLEPGLPEYEPRCPTEDLLAPVLNTPPDGAVVTDIWPIHTWTYPDRTCDPEGYRIDLSVDPTFADTSLSGGTGNPSTAWAAGHPLEDCQIYHWRVAGINDITLGPFSASQWFRIDTRGSCPPVFRFTRNAFCRSGPGQAYRELTGITASELVEVIGRNQDNSWWHIFWSQAGLRCWVSDATGVFTGDPDQLPVVEVDPPPACSRHTDSRVCSNDPACQWVMPARSAQGYCTEK